MNNKVRAVQDTLQAVKFDNGDILLDKLTGSEIYQLSNILISKVETTNQDLVTEFNETFKAEKETTNIVEDFKFKELRIALVQEELLELAFALGYPRQDVYALFIKQLEKVYSNSPFIDNGERTVEVFDAVLDLLVVTYGIPDIFNMASAVPEGMKEVHNSNMSKLCNNIDEVKLTVEKYREEGIELVSEETPKGYVVKNRDTGKILKSILFKKPNLKNILIKHKIL